MVRNEESNKPPRRIDPIRRISSESPNGNQRIVIDPVSQTVTFIGCHKKAPSSFFTLYRPHQAEFVCPFSDILQVYEYDVQRSAGKLGGLGPRRFVSEITTVQGTARFTTVQGTTLLPIAWSNYEATRDALTEISKSTPDPPTKRNPKIVNRLMFIIAGIMAAIVMGLVIWLT